MASGFERQSATIYPFPSRVRPTVGGHAAHEAVITSLTPLSASRVAFGGAWYHEEAVRDAERKN